MTKQVIRGLELWMLQLLWLIKWQRAEFVDMINTTRVLYGYDVHKL